MIRFPLLPFYLGIATGIAAALISTLLATSLPWLGLTLESQGNAVVIADETREMPLPLAGAKLMAIGPENGDLIPLLPGDLIDEPDALPRMSDMVAFFERQGTLHHVLGHDKVTLDTASETGESRQITLEPLKQRPASSLPPRFWFQILVGAVSLVIASFVLALRGRDFVSSCLAASGFGLMLAAHAAAVYSTRELALSASLFNRLSAVNSTGASLFGVSMILLFMNYPVALPHRKLHFFAILPFVICLGLVLARIDLPTEIIVHGAISMEMLFIILGIGLQVYLTRNKPKERAALRWLGIAITFGAGGFILTVALPLAIGQSPQVTQAWAFGFFLIFFLGVVLGVARFRLFDAAEWSFRVLFYGLGVALFFLLDACLIYIVSLDRLPAFSISMLLVASLYLPMRGFLWSRLHSRGQMSEFETFAAISAIGLSPEPGVDIPKYRALLQKIFDPVTINFDTHSSASGLVGSGEGLRIAAERGVPSYEMNWANKGRRLFSPQDLDRALTIQSQLATLVDQRNRMAASQSAERTRIYRELHDNIGVQLLGALHSESPVRKDRLLRQALSDLREIVSGNSPADLSFADVLADMRSELTAHLQDRNVDLEWHADIGDIAGNATTAALTLRSVLRESVANILHHADARSARISIERSGTTIGVTVQDDGKGRSAQTPATDHQGGTGLAGLHKRLTSIGGALDTADIPDGGFRLRAQIPLNRSAVPEAAPIMFDRVPPERPEIQKMPIEARHA